MSTGNMVAGAEALLGKTFGNSLIHGYTGIGRMGIVYLGVQAMPRRDVAVKIVAPVAARTPEERLAFAERFLRRCQEIAALQHPNILPVYDFGVTNGMAYLVMPYIRSGTLFDLLNREGKLPLAQAADYLEQLADALHCAHLTGIIHSDITPSNIFLTPDNRPLLSDFALAGIATERPVSQVRLLKAGITLGTLKYLAPEQVLGEEVTPAADVYALAIVLYEMLTGQTPFDGTSPVSLAAQLVQDEPPPPRLRCADLPEAAERVILQALAKNPLDRFAGARAMAAAFTAALKGREPAPASAQTPLPEVDVPVKVTPLSPANRQNSLFSPVWQNVSQSGIEVIEQGTTVEQASFASPTMPAGDRFAAASNQLSGGITGSLTGTQTPLPPPRLGRKSHVLRPLEDTSAVEQEVATGEQVTLHNPGRSFVTEDIPPLPAASAADSAAIPVTDLPPSLPVTATPAENEQAETPAQKSPAAEPDSGTMKLPSTLKIVQLPVAGQPGRYITGLLPVLPEESSEDANDEFDDEDQTTDEPPARRVVARLKTRVRKLSLRQKIVAAALAALLIICGSGVLLLVRGHAQPQANRTAQQKRSLTTAPNPAATARAYATATATANTILYDPLSQNIHNWPVAQSGAQRYFFADGTYHIFDNANGRSAPAFLPGFDLKEPLVYTVTMEEVKGDTSSLNNSFGMLLFFSSQDKGGHTIVTFYSFEVVNMNGGQYQFWKYDSSNSASPWKSLWHSNFGKEYHQGEGSKNVNMLTVASDNGIFTFIVNGKKVGTMHDASFNGGEIGLLVNLQGTEVAFSNLRLSYNLTT